MRHAFHRIGRVAVCFATLGMALPVSPTVFAGEPSISVPQIVDIELADAGVMHGQLTNRNGVALADADVSLIQNGQIVERSTTNVEGRFQFSGLRGGLYVLQSQDSTMVCRLWAPRTAPPQASHGALLIAGGTAERGNLVRSYGVGVVIVMGVIAAIIAVAAAKDDKPASS